ncbi:MAG: RNA polymerase sigma factor [Acetatifactor sp.]|nr:RNA polymerase sigma factor [Acetatifactor sp.]
MPVFKELDSNANIRFDELYHKYAKNMHRQTFDILKDVHEAEDAVQEAFIRIWGSMDKVQKFDEPRVESFLICVARNAAIDIYRKKKDRWHREEPYDESFPYAFDPVLAVDENSFQEKILRFPNREREVIDLKYTYGFRYWEIAKILGISVVAVKKDLKRAKERLKKLCQEEGIDND